VSEWTPLAGLRRATVRALLRAVPGTVILGAAIWLATPVLDLFSVATTPHAGALAVFAICGFVFLLAGMALGHGLCRGIVEIAGCSSIPLSSIMLAIAVGTTWLATSLTSLDRPLGAWQPFIIVAVGLGAAVWIVRTTLLDT
jgi:hypothetical protein